MQFQPRNSDKTGKYKTLKPRNKKSASIFNERMIDAISDIIECIEGDCKDPTSNGENAIAVHKIIRDITRSSQAKQMVILS